MEKQMNDVLSLAEINGVHELELEIKKSFKVKRVSLFGSVARAEADDESDLDVLIILSDKVTHRIRNTISDMAFEVNLKHGTNISLMIFDEEVWSSDMMKITPFYSEVVRDGVSVYEAQNAIRLGLIDKQVGRLYDELFNARQQGDYAPLVEFDKEVVSEQAVDVSQLLPQLRLLVTQLLDSYEKPNGV